MIRFTALALILAATPSHADIRPLSLDEAIALSLKNNSELAVAGIAPRQAAAEVTQQRGAFDPVLTLFGGMGRDRSPQGAVAFGTFRNTFTAEARLSGRLSTGTEYGFSYGTTRVETDSQLSPSDPSSSAYVQLDLRQPLLRGFGRAANRAGITIARGNERIANLALRREAEHTIARTVDAYWRLVRAHRSVDVARESLELAQQLAQRAQSKVAAGELPTIELTQARASIAAREEAVILGEAEVGNANDALARIIAIDPQVFEVTFSPTDAPDAPPTAIAAPAVLADALKQRAELQVARLTVRNAEVALDAARNQQRPDLSAVASVGIGGLDPRWTSAHAELATDDQVRWSAGLVFSVPIGNRTAGGAYEKARLAVDEAKLALRSLELQITEEVRAAVRNLDASSKRVEATRRATELAREQLTAGEKRLSTGLATSFEIVRLQTDLATAQNAENAAVTSYQVSLVGVRLASGSLAR